VAVREFNGSSDYIRVDGAFGNLNDATTPMSCILVAKSLAVPPGPGIEAFTAWTNSADLAVGSLYEDNDRSLGCLTGDPSAISKTDSLKMLDGQWQILGLSKAAGAAPIELYWTMIGGALAHMGSGFSLGSTSVSCTRWYFGGFNATGGLRDCRIAVAALYDVALTPTNFDSVRLALSSRSMNDLGPISLIEFDQTSASDPVVDWNAIGAQAAISGTTVVLGDDPPDWSFGVTITSLLFSLRLSGGSANEDPALSIGGALSSARVQPNLFDNMINAQRLSGLTDYRLIYIHNDDTADGNAVAYVPNQFETSRTLAIGVPTQAANTTVTAIANDTTAPAGVTFSSPSTSGTGLSLGTIPAGGFRGLWLRRTVGSGLSPDPTNQATIRVEMTRSS